MNNHPATNSQPFWKDELDLQNISPPVMKRMPGFFRIYLYAVISILAVGAFALLYYISHVLFWFALLYLVLSVGIGWSKRKTLKTATQHTFDIQEQAKKQTGAVAIGSAVHVAGHPRLDREQAVVLALAEPGELDFYDYGGKRLDALRLDEILALHTVVYDDERIAHIDTVDSTAQALQITFQREGKEFTALFRRMKNVRPIDWYHLIQSRRLGATRNTNQAL